VGLFLRHDQTAEDVKMGMQEHAGEMEQKPEDDIAAQPEEQQKPESTEEAASQVEDEGEKTDAKEEGPKSKVEEVVSDAVKKYGPQPPVEKLMELALVLGYLPGTGEYAELMNAVQKFCGNGYAALLEGEFAKAADQPAVEQKKQEQEGGEPPEDATEADAAEGQAEQTWQEGGDEKQPADPATAETQGPVAEEVPPELAEEPAVQEAVAGFVGGDPDRQAAPAAEDVKEENAAEVEAQPAQEEEVEEESAGPPQEDLRRGDKNPEVEDLQNLLVQMGFMTQEEMDTGPGTFGPRTEHALKAYQAELGLPATGFYGPMTRESLAKAAEPASPTEKVVQGIVAKHGPKPDMGVLVAAFMTVDASMQEEFIGAVAKQCGEEHATQLRAEIENAAAAEAEAQAPATEETKPEEAPAPVAEEKPAEEQAATPAPVPEEAVETQAPVEEQVAVQEQVVEVAPEVVPEEAKEEVAAPEAAPEEKPAEEEASASPVGDMTEEVAQDQAEQPADDAAAAPTAEPEEKEQAAEAQQEEIAKDPEEAQVTESEAAPESEEEVEADKEEVTNELEDEVQEQPDSTESVAALQALMEEADRILAASTAILKDPVLDTTQDTIEADAESMLENWDGDIDNQVQQLEELADKLTSGDLGQTPGMEDAVQAASDKSQELRDQAASLKDSAPAQVDVKVELSEGGVLGFVAPVSSRDSAVADILNTFLEQLELREGERAEEEPEPLADDAPAEV
jgi:peptidoglycan hydrolase-like protein with peptidoglycan-binding domain